MDTIILERLGILMNLLAGVLLSIDYFFDKNSIKYAERKLDNFVEKYPRYKNVITKYYPWGDGGPVKIISYFFMIIVIFYLIFISISSIQDIYFKLNGILSDLSKIYSSTENVEGGLEFLENIGKYNNFYLREI